MTVYILHFDKAIGSNKHKARHYAGYTSREINKRLREHLAKSNPVPIVRAFVEKGINYKIGKIWHDEGREFERHIKKVGRKISNHCLICREERIILNQVEGKIMTRTYYVCGFSRDFGGTIEGKPFILNGAELKEKRKEYENSTDGIMVLHKFTVKVMTDANEAKIEIENTDIASEAVKPIKKKAINHEDIPF